MYKFQCEDFDLEQTLDCGQAFRWNRVEENKYRGFFLDNYLEISQTGDVFTFNNINEDTFYKIWYNYFDFSTKYTVFKTRFFCDETLKTAIATSPGLRILRQDGWETLISFIISQNNNIKRIKNILQSLCEHFGHFPTPLEIIDTDLSFLRAGFRDKYLKDAAAKVENGEVILNNDITADQLKVIKGVGDKVAACVLLYGFYKLDVFPIDVWMKRVLEKFYKDGFPPEFKDVQGVAQAYLFNFIRKNQIPLEN